MTSQTIFKKSTALVGLLAGALIAFSGGALAQTSDVESNATATELRLSCTANGVRDFSMASRYQLRRGRKTFDAEFEAAATVGFRAGQRLGVNVGGVSVGAITLRRDPANGDIIGALEFDTNPAEGNPFPANFPAVRSGTSVTVGALGCALR